MKLFLETLFISRQCS